MTMTASTVVPEVRAGNARGVNESRYADAFRWALLTGVLALGLVAPGAGFAEDLVLAGASEAQKPVLSWETRAGRSYGIPALEVTGFILTLNQFNRRFIDPEVYGTNYSTFRTNVTRAQVIDTDPFAVNQILHPYQGSIYFGSARSAGLTYWESLGFTLAGSMLWETAGETGPASINDHIATGIGGTFLGEALFRMASLALKSGGGTPGFGRELGAAVISPPTGFNRLVFGNRFDAVFPSRHPATFLRLRLGGSLTVRRGDQGVSSTVNRKEVTGDLSLAYGLPGKPGYGYTRPFDYFDFQLTFVDSSYSVENTMTRGLLLGKKYALGDAYRGIWGLYGSYDYISPQVFRVSTTALSLGTTAQWWLSRAVALQGTALGGIGFGAAGTIAGAGERDYHYGTTPQGLLALRFILGNVAMLDFTGRGYYVSGTGSPETQGWERIARGNASVTVRVHGRHALGLQYVASQRDAHYPGLVDRHQTVGTVSLAYNYLGDTHFGAVEWRDADRR
jgi:hypothetical protein